MRELSRELPSVISVSLVPAKALRIHEMVDTRRVAALAREMLSEGVLRRPIVVDSRTMTILDGHHRHAAVLRLGLSLIPAILVDYSSPEIGLRSWRDVRVSKEDVVRAALLGRPMPPKTSRHIFPFDQERLDLPLKLLRRRCFVWERGLE